jgi:hypothetical protein
MSPASGTPWSKKDKDLLVRTFDSVLDLFHPAQEDGEKAPQT